MNWLIYVILQIPLGRVLPAFPSDALKPRPRLAQTQVVCLPMTSTLGAGRCLSWPVAVRKCSPSFFEDQPFIWAVLPSEAVSLEAYPEDSYLGRDRDGAFQKDGQGFVRNQAECTGLFQEKKTTFQVTVPRHV